MSGILYICPTPLGNLQDITLRALAVLKDVDLIVAEDTRHSRKLLNHFNIEKPLISYHQHSPPSRGREIMRQLQEGKNVAMISDCGTPAISDPGRELIASIIDAGITLRPLPGPSAVVTALSASGFPLARFSFFGFLPRKGLAKAVKEIARIEHPVVLYESPRRVEKLLAILAQTMPQRQLMMARELTKMHEQLLRGTVEELAEHTDWQQVARGEFTIVLGPWQLPQQVPDEAELAERLENLLDGGMSVRDACRQLSNDTGASRRRLYALANKKK